MNLKQEMLKLPKPETDLKPPYWEYWRLDLWARATSDNPENFTKWPCVYHTMLQNHWMDLIKYEYLMLPSRWQFLAQMPKHLDDDYIGASLALIHQLYHLYQWQNATGLLVENLEFIYEFGGGFGAMAMACRRLGFKGQYIIQDLPEFSLLQKWYLSENEIDGVEWVDELSPQNTDLLIASYSLSEVDMGYRQKVLNNIRADSYLFLYSNRFEDYDNVSYFQNLNIPKRWQHKPLRHMPPESWYTFGS